MFWLLFSLYTLDAWVWSSLLDSAGHRAANLCGCGAMPGGDQQVQAERTDHRQKVHEAYWDDCFHLKGRVRQRARQRAP